MFQVWLVNYLTAIETKVVNIFPKVRFKTQNFIYQYYYTKFCYIWHGGLTKQIASREIGNSIILTPILAHIALLI